jgi:hypothetical protein
MLMDNRDFVNTGAERQKVILAHMQQNAAKSKHKAR